MARGPVVTVDNIFGLLQPWAGHGTQYVSLIYRDLGHGTNYLVVRALEGTRQSTVPDCDRL